mmetsp:Transcript_8863/g.14213  ORF Transcript_8863/g.14213 Transcript_8863/m.14213 type:complete len:303 (+) Transcript_8863:70-978(+)
MEEELLQGMIRDRESQIKLIEKKLEDQKQKMERVAQEKIKIGETIQVETVQHAQELETLQKQLQTALRQYRASKDSLDMKKQQQQQQQTASTTSTPMGPGLHVYSEIMKSVTTPESNESSYVLRMQAQLCKAMHNMGMMETQLQLTTVQQEVFQKSLKDVVTGMVEEKSQVELKLMNDLVIADNARREVETKRKELTDAFTAEKDELMEKIERQNEEPEEGEEPEEDDEEEKEELKEILTQGREELERLEQENKQQEEILEELKQKVALSKGQDVVDDIVTSIAEEFKEREEEDEEEEEEDD